jgi:hypothetical protein
MNWWTQTRLLSAFGSFLILAGCTLLYIGDAHAIGVLLLIWGNNCDEDRRLGHA